LIDCPACGRRLSAQALSCPGCGHPIVTHLDKWTQIKHAGTLVSLVIIALTLGVQAAFLKLLTISTVTDFS